MNSRQLTQSIAAWIEQFLRTKFGSEYSTITVMQPEKNLNLLSDATLRAIKGSTAWEFKPDIMAILTRTDGTSDIVLINRSTSAISLKEIGEMNCYAQLAQPLFAMVVSPKAASNEVNGILLDIHMRDRIVDYSGRNPIAIVGWNEETGMPQADTISPIEMESFFLG